MEIDELPAEVLVNVLGYVQEASQLSRLAEVSRRWRALAEADELWRELFRRRWAKDEVERRSRKESNNTAATTEEPHLHEDDEPTAVQVNWDQKWEDFQTTQKPPDASWKAFYLDHLRGPVERLLSELDRQPLGLAQLSKVTFRSSAPSLSSASTPPPEGTSDVWIRELLNLSRSARLQEALSAYPRACRDRLEVMRESVLTRLNFLRRARSMLFLGKLGLFAYLVKRFVPSLYPLPSNFLTVRPTMGSLLRFWPLYAYCATYYYAQRLLGRRGYLEGTPKWYLGVAKFCNHVLSSVLEEAGLRWLCIHPFIISIVVANGLIRAGTFGIALLTAFGCATQLVIQNRQGFRLVGLVAVGLSVSLAYCAARFDFLLQALSRLGMPVFHAVTRNAYRDVIARQGDDVKVKHFHLFVVGLFAMNSLVHLVSRLASLKLAFSSSIASGVELTLTLRSIFSSSRPSATGAAASSTAAAGGAQPVKPPSSPSWWAQLWRLLDQRAVASQLLSLINGNVVGWTMCHAAIHHGFPTVVILKLLYEAQVLLLQLSTIAAARSGRRWH